MTKKAPIGREGHYLVNYRGNRAWKAKGEKRGK